MCCCSPHDDDGHDDIVCSFFSTALHAVRIQTEKSNTKHSNNNNVVNEPQVTWKEVASFDEDYHHPVSSSSSSTSMVCVGYSSCPGWEAFVLLDTSTIPLSQILDPAETAATTTVPLSSNLADDVSITTAATTSGVVMTTAHESSVSKRGGGVDGGGGGPRRSVSSSEISLPPEESVASDFDESANINSNHNTDSGIHAKLILRSLVEDNGNEDNDGNDGHQVDPPRCYSTQLSFRPLAPVVRLRTKTNNIPIIWLGSADTSKLYCFTLGEKVVFTDAVDSTKYEDVLQTRIDLVPIALSDPAFKVDSPVMALDCLNICYNKDEESENNENENTEQSISSSRGGCCCCLAISCQDGTIRFITFSPNAISNGPVDSGAVVGAFDSVQATTFIIDGPAVCLHLSCSNHHCHDSTDVGANQQYQGHPVYATIGSLCGYVTVLYTRDIFGKVMETDALASETSSSNDNDIRKNDSISWEGPFIMAEGFWNQHLEAEDSVLAVHDVGRNGMVALGTHAGRCFLYQAVNKSRITSNRHSSFKSSQDVYNNGDDDKYGEHHLYRRLWECQLPYPIHGICHLPNYNRSSSSDNNITPPLSLLVTTRKSVHLFTQQQPKIVYDASLAKKRIDALLLQIQQQQQQQQQKEDAEEVAESATTREAELNATSLGGNTAAPDESNSNESTKGLQEREIETGSQKVESGASTNNNIEETTNENVVAGNNDAVAADISLAM